MVVDVDVVVDVVVVDDVVVDEVVIAADRKITAVYPNMPILSLIFPPQGRAGLAKRCLAWADLMTQAQHTKQQRADQTVGKMREKCLRATYQHSALLCGALRTKRD